MEHRDESNPWEAAAPRGMFHRHERPEPGPLDRLTRVLAVSAVLLQLAALAYVALNYPALPGTVPTHFNALGEADDWVPGAASGWGPGSSPS